MSKQSLLKALQSVENMHTYMAEERTQTIIADIRASIENGTTLRDQFAMAALQGMLSNSMFDGVNQPMCTAPSHLIAGWAYEHADAMLRAREDNSK